MMVSRPWGNGFRHITSSTRVIKTPEGLKGSKIRVPPAPMHLEKFSGKLA
jgi:TRAP-type C4-dicarboxylate transport system substrate-binding protein